MKKFVRFRVATARNQNAITNALGPDNEQLLSVELDVADVTQARRAVDAAVAIFSAIDVLVNNAGYGHLRYFEELTMQDAEAQFATNLNGVFNVTWATLPLMRRARQGEFSTSRRSVESLARSCTRSAAQASSRSKDSPNRWLKRSHPSAYT